MPTKSIGELRALIPLALLHDRQSDLWQKAGPKAGNLGLAIHAGMMVPDGYAVLPDEVEEATLTLAEALSRITPPWIVRSSARGEDGAFRSAAGVFDSHGGLCSPNEVLSAIRAVTDSRFLERAHSYFGRVVERLPTIIQTQIIPESGGVAFTRDPVSGERQVVVEASASGPASVVQGEGHPDRFSWAMGHFQQVKAGQDTMSRWGSAQRTARHPFSCSREVVRDVVRLARRAELVLGCPADIEWAVDRSSRLWLLQMRPLRATGPER